MPLAENRRSTVEDIYALPEGERAELIDGQLYDMAAPNRIHQALVTGFGGEIREYIKRHRGACRVYVAPFAVFLNGDESIYLEPDVSVICDLEKLDDRGCCGAPDWVIEVTSPATKQRDYGIKLYRYRLAGVREYWVVNPDTRTVMVYDFSDEGRSNQYQFSDVIPVGIYAGFQIKVDDLLSY